MPWLRIDDGLPDHPKILRAGIDAAWMHVCGLAYCARYLTDGVVQAEVVGGLLRGLRPPAQCLKLAERLVEVGSWKRHPEGYEIHDYLEYNPSREQVLKKRASTRERVARARNARTTALPEAYVPRSNSVGNGVSTRLAVVAPYPNPITPTPRAFGRERPDVESVSNDPRDNGHEEPSTTPLRAIIADLERRKAMP